MAASIMKEYSWPGVFEEPVLWAAMASPPMLLSRTSHHGPTLNGWVTSNLVIL